MRAFYLCRPKIGEGIHFCFLKAGVGVTFVIHRKAEGFTFAIGKYVLLHGTLQSSDSKNDTLSCFHKRRGYHSCNGKSGEGNTLAIKNYGWGTVAVFGVHHWLLGVWLGGVWEGVNHHEPTRAHFRLLRHMPPHRGEGRLCMFFCAGGGSGPHGEGQGTAIFKKCA